MAKLKKKVTKNEDRCKKLHLDMNTMVAPTKLVDPKLYVIVDTDELQKQMNHLENRMNHAERLAARSNWRRGRKNEM